MEENVQNSTQKQSDSLQTSDRTRVPVRLLGLEEGSGGGEGTGERSGGLQQQPWNGERSRLTGGGSLGCRVALRGRGRGLALALLEDVQTFSQAAEGGSGRGFEEEEVLVQTGQRTSGGEGVDGVDQGLLLALCLGHDLGRRKRHIQAVPPNSGAASDFLRTNLTFVTCTEMFNSWGVKTNAGEEED